MTACVTAVCATPTHAFSKATQLAIRLVTDLGVAGDAHMGATVQHRSRIARDSTLRNLRQVHLIHAELHDELRAKGFDVAPGQIGENITTRGIDLLALPARTRLHIGAVAIVELTGLRNPCTQLNKFQPGLMEATLDHDANGELIRKAGVMGVVIAGGDIHPGDDIRVKLPTGQHEPLKPV